MSKTEPNAPAFSAMEKKENDAMFDAEEVFYLGLTKREYFAAMAMQGMIAFYGSESAEQDANSIRDAVMYADKLIEQLNKETNDKG